MVELVRRLTGRPTGASHHFQQRNAVKSPRAGDAPVMADGAQITGGIKAGSPPTAHGTGNVSVAMTVAVPVISVAFKGIAAKTEHMPLAIRRGVMAITTSGTVDIQGIRTTGVIPVREIVMNADAINHAANGAVTGMVQAAIAARNPSGTSVETTGADFLRWTQTVAVK